MSTNANNTDGWIKMTDRQPTVADGAIATWNAQEKKFKVFTDPSPFYYRWHSDYTHWKPLKLSEPPKEETHVEKDMVAFKRFYDGSVARGGYNYAAGIWYAAIAYEREAIRELIEEAEKQGVPVRLTALKERVKAE